MIDVWTLETCPKCDELKVKLKELGKTFEVKKCEDLQSGEVVEPEVMMYLAQQNFSAPVVFNEGVYVSPENYSTL